MTIEVSPSSISDSFLDRDAFLTGLLNQVTGSEKDDCLQQLRDGAVKWVRHSVIPNTRDEEWRFTDLSPLKQIDFKLGMFQEISLESDILSEVSQRLVFVNGVYSPDLSHTEDLPAGLKVGNLDVLSDEVAQQYLAQSEGTREVFTALNTAALNDVAVVWVGKNVVVETPIHLLFVSVSGESATISQPRVLVVAESNSQVGLIEEYTNHRDTENTEKEVYFTNGVTEIWVNENAQVSHNRVVREGAAAFHVGKTAVTQARYSRYSCNAVTVGGRISRHNLEILQTGEQTETTLNGLTVIGDNQLADTHSALSLNHPHGVSKQLHKCIIGDRAHGVFNGKVFVPKPAQLTNASQLNRNLLLSSKSRIDTKPQLEITADNVKCAHGATVSQLEDDQIFYLQSRGIDENNARKLLVNGFAMEVINFIPVASLRESLLKTVTSLTNK
ncbi:Fe-S cluster assembly protein SufD [Dolichospermum sp. LEGE 00240]|jgi:Fe-S cluster assembly protein SufD|uniref:Fe-S cluster assembly protein SufD n=1 Tax=Dolichospermum sp. LEGE 00240 TaxID=1828603 RepID=UPI00187F2D77|nr:Fe-S cluster assembly protein SufD [Dolichospermum sp. LEGE 00240]MDM3846258.1 Fe-S cluster assembly protein SufD [Aphanizomenon gracile PMC638.10]MDM3851023.1 Fe-S cluster assembly protein SufD [Aphanizomenon gracile PMC627.10]MDM3855812.1 Fe-S cluster assembly protein SufD [Aphanizomenon gracile PMC649.10]MDM3860740.1 Fe-S cluster assembly protein SufD [Aphanizomenon gracile PMC644.10]MBE9248264.1 Fe-S cluster assembly protein SufD [Dolichospermum sp. LEGE 00240]